MADTPAAPLETTERILTEHGNIVRGRVLYRHDNGEVTVAGDHYLFRQLDGETGEVVGVFHA